MTDLLQKGGLEPCHPLKRLERDGRLRVVAETPVGVETSRGNSVESVEKEGGLLDLQDRCLLRVSCVVWFDSSQFRNVYRARCFFGIGGPRGLLTTGAGKPTSNDDNAACRRLRCLSTPLLLLLLVVAVAAGAAAGSRTEAVPPFTNQPLPTCSLSLPTFPVPHSHLSHPPSPKIGHGTCTYVGRS